MDRAMAKLEENRIFAYVKLKVQEADRGYWNKLENYLEEHSEADVSHGICPDCVKALDPQLERLAE